MGEYVKYRGVSTKIGSCESMYYATLQEYKRVLEAGFLQQDGNGNARPDVYLMVKSECRFRFPFPDENHKELFGNYDDFDRGVLFNIPIGIVEMSHTQSTYKTLANRFITEADGFKPFQFQMPCVQSVDFDFKAVGWKSNPQTFQFEVIQQKQVEVDGQIEFQTCIRCPFCGTVCRMDRAEALALLEFSQKNSTYFNELQLLIIDLIVEGYPKVVETI